MNRKIIIAGGTGFVGSYLSSQTVDAALNDIRTMSKDDTHILLFDGVCNLCNKIVQFTIKRDPGKKFKFASLQSQTGQALLKRFGLPDNNFDSFVYIRGDKCFIKSSAALHVLKELGGAWKLPYAFIIIPARLRDFIYNLIAKNRYKIFGKQDACMIPRPELQQRFLQ